MQYLLLIHSNERVIQAMSEAQVSQTIAAYQTFTEALQKDGILLGRNRLRPTASATTVRISNGKTQVLNGPYAETKEQLGGYYLIEAPDLAAAQAWAAKCPNASMGTMEVRPIWSM